MRDCKSEQLGKRLVNTEPVNLRHHLEGEAECDAKQSFNSDGVEEYATFEASFDEYKGINEALLVFLWEHVFELEEEIVELVL